MNENKAVPVEQSSHAVGVLAVGASRPRGLQRQTSTMKGKNATSVESHAQGAQVAQGMDENIDTPIVQSTRGTQVAQGMNESTAVPVKQSSHAVGVLTVGASPPRGLQRQTSTMKGKNATSVESQAQGAQVAEGMVENNDTPIVQSTRGTQVAQGMNENKAVPVEQSSHAVGVVAVGASRPRGLQCQTSTMKGNSATSVEKDSQGAQLAQEINENHATPGEQSTQGMHAAQGLNENTALPLEPSSQAVGVLVVGATQPCGLQRQTSVMIQKASRRIKGRVDFKKRTACAITIQVMVRHFLAKRNCNVAERVVIVLQSCVRMFLATVALRRKRNAAILIQCVVRCMLVRVDLLVCHYAAFEIQSAWRGYRERNFFTLEAAAIKLQSQVRKIIALKVVEKTKRELSCCHTGEMSGNPQDSLPLEVEIISRADMHAQLLAFESKRRSTYAPVLKTSFLKWRSSMDSLQASVQEMVHAEHLIFGSAVANQVYGDAMQDVSEDGFSFHSDGSSMTGSRNQKRFQTNRTKYSHNDTDEARQTHAYMDIADEMTLVREELETQVSALAELGGSIIEALESAEMGVIEVWGKALHRSSVRL